VTILIRLLALLLSLLMFFVAYIAVIIIEFRNLGLAAAACLWGLLLLSCSIWPKTLNELYKKWGRE
jgi:uncharacterized membrane protein